MNAKVLLGTFLVAGIIAVSACNPEPPVDPRDPGKPPCEHPTKPPGEEPPTPWPPVEEPPREEPPNEPGACTETGTFVKAVCGTSLFNNYWIKPDNGGAYIVPCRSDAGIPANIYEGMRVQYAYVGIKGSCSNGTTCQVYFGPTETVLITCVEVLNSTER